MKNAKRIAAATKNKNPGHGSRAEGWLAVSAPIGIFLVTAMAFFPALGNDFVRWDDDKNLLDNPYYRGLGLSQLRWMFTTFLMGHYQPLSWVTFGLDYLLWGMNPFGYHLTNVVLHAANAVLFYFIARTLLSAALFVSDGEKPWQLNFSAMLAVLLFAIHPLRVESVAWITERRDVLSGVFYLTTLNCYLRAARMQPPNGRWPWLGAALVAYVLSLLSKGTAMTLPAVLLLLDIYPLRRFSLRNAFKPEFRGVLAEKLPFLVLAGVFAVIALHAQHTGEAIKSLQQYDLISRAMQIFYGLIFYLRKTLFPTGLSPIYELPINFEPWAGAFLLSAASTTIISLVLYFLRQRWPAALACWVYYIIVLTPVSGIAQSGPQLVADRYSYLACLSWPLLIAGWFFRSWPAPGTRTCQRRLAAASMAAGLILFTLASLTWSQNKVWRNTQTLWQHAIAVTPDASIAYYNLGRTFESKDDIDQAVELYRRALVINPEYAKAHINLAGLLVRRGREAEAIAHYRSALKFRPDNAGAHNNLGVLLEMRGEVEAALAEFQKALQIDPNFDKALFNIGKLFAQKGDLSKAASHYQQAARLSPHEVDFQIGLAIVLARQGQLESATNHLLAAVKLRPDDADAHVLLARSLAAQGKKQEAERHYQQALRLMKSQNLTPPSQ